MSRTVDVDQSKMMREATLGFFVLMLLLGVLAFTIYAKATGLFTATAVDHLSPARLVEMDANGDVILPTPKSQLLVPLPDNESNSIVNLDSMKRISADQLFGNRSESVRMASADPALEDSVSNDEVLDAIPNRPGSSTGANGLTRVAESGLPGPTIASQESATEVDGAQSLAQGLPEAKVAAVPELGSTGTEPGENPTPDTLPNALPRPTFYQKLSEQKLIEQKLGEQKLSDASAVKEGESADIGSSPSQLDDQPVNPVEVADNPFPSLPNALRQESSSAESQSSLPTLPGSSLPRPPLPGPPLPGPPLRSPKSAGEDQVIDDEGATLIAPVTPETNIASQVTHTQPIEQDQIERPERFDGSPANSPAISPAIAMQDSSVPPSLPNTLRRTVQPQDAANAGQLPENLSAPIPDSLPNELRTAPSSTLSEDDSIAELSSGEGASLAAGNSSAASPSADLELANENDILSQRLKQAAELHADMMVENEAKLNPESLASESPALETLDSEMIAATKDDSGLALDDKADLPEQRQRSEQIAAATADTAADESPSVKPAGYSQAQIRAALRMVELQANENLSDVAKRVYGTPEWAVAMFQLNRHRASSTGQFAVGTKIMFLPQPMMEFLYPDHVPQALARPKLLQDTETGSANQIETVDYNEAVSEPTLLLYQTKGGETLFGLAAEYLGQASRFSELLELNQPILQGRWGHLDPLPAGLQLRFPAE